MNTRTRSRLLSAINRAEKAFRPNVRVFKGRKTVLLALVRRVNDCGLGDVLMGSKVSEVKSIAVARAVVARAKAMLA